jgi:hydrogenase small subunit
MPFMESDTPEPDSPAGYAPLIRTLRGFTLRVATH